MKDEMILQKILNYIREIKQFIVGYDYNKFQQDKKTINACVFNLSQIGELVTKMSEKTIHQHPNIEWRGLKGLRNKIVHDYDGINLNMVWRIFRSRFKRIRNSN